MSNLVPKEYSAGLLPGRNELAMDQSLPPKAIPSCIRSSRFDCCLVNIRKLLLACLGVTCVFGVKDAFDPDWFAKNLAFEKLDALGSEIISPA